MDNLDEFLSGNAPVAEVETTEAPEATEVVEQVEAEAEAKPERARGPDGKFIPKGEPETAETVAPPATKEPELDHAALIGERRRRQEAEQRIEALERQFAQMQAPPVQQQPQTPPDRWEDPDGYDQWLVTQVSARATEAARQEAQNAFQYQRIEMAAAQARTTLPDYDEKIGVFGQLVEQNPALLDQLYRAPNPAEYAYNTAKTQLEISQYGGIDGLIQARVEAALAAKAPEPAATPPIPDTLADAQSARGNASGGFHVPSLDEILKR